MAKPKREDCDRDAQVVIHDVAQYMQRVWPVRHVDATRLVRCVCQQEVKEKAAVTSPYDLRRASSSALSHSLATSPYRLSATRAASE